MHYLLIFVEVTTFLTEADDDLDNEAADGWDDEVADGLGDEVADRLGDEVADGLDDEVADGLDDEAADGLDDEVANGLDDVEVLLEAENVEQLPNIVLRHSWNIHIQTILPTEMPKIIWHFNRSYPS